MDRFGEAWVDHATRIERAWTDLGTEDDVLILAGDLSWAMTVEEAKDDIAWMRGLVGKKVLIRGNHDFWWSGIGKVRAALGESMYPLQHDHVVLERIAFVGTRGWQCPGSIGSADMMVDKDGAAGTSSYTAQDQKIYDREVGRLRLGLQGLRKSGEAFDKLVVVLHYPPMNPAHEASGFTDLIDEFEADVCLHGHLHGEASIATAFQGVRGRTTYHCVSADAVKMIPRQVL